MIQISVYLSINAGFLVMFVGLWAIDRQKAR